MVGLRKLRCLERCNRAARAHTPHVQQSGSGPLGRRARVPSSQALRWKVAATDEGRGGLSAERGEGWLASLSTRVVPAGRPRSAVPWPARIAAPGMKTLGPGPRRRRASARRSAAQPSPAGVAGGSGPSTEARHSKAHCAPAQRTRLPGSEEACPDHWISLKMLRRLGGERGTPSGTEKRTLGLAGPWYGPGRG